MAIAYKGWSRTPIKPSYLTVKDPGNSSIYDLINDELFGTGQFPIREEEYGFINIMIRDKFEIELITRSLIHDRGMRQKVGVVRTKPKEEPIIPLTVQQELF